MTREGLDGDGLTIPGYDRFRLIGRGGFSAVYQARQIAYDRPVAVKLLDVGIDDASLRRRVTREREVTGRLTGHPNIVTILDSGFLEDGRPFLAMALCPGGSLADRLARQGPLTVQETLRIGVRIAGALETAHRLGVVHRDVKPENVLVTAIGEPALADFGISTVADHRAHTRNTQAYTPNHAPPEVLRGEPASGASDLYNLGSTLYQLLAGRAPFAQPESGLATFVDKVLNAPPPPFARPDVPASLVAALTKAMGKDPADRHGSAAEFGRALQEVQRELGQRVDDVPVMTASDVPRDEPLTAPAATVDPPRPDIVPPPAGAATLQPPRPGTAPPPAAGDPTVLPPRPEAGTPAPAGAATVLPPRPDAGAPLPPGDATVLPPRPEVTPSPVGGDATVLPPRTGGATPAGGDATVKATPAGAGSPPRPSDSGDRPERRRRARVLVISAVVVVVLAGGGVTAWALSDGGGSSGSASYGYGYPDYSGETSSDYGSDGEGDGGSAASPAPDESVGSDSGSDSGSDGESGGGSDEGSGNDSGDSNDSGSSGGSDSGPTPAEPEITSIALGEETCDGSSGTVVVFWEADHADNVQFYNASTEDFLGGYHGASGQETLSGACEPGADFTVKAVPQLESSAGPAKEISSTWPQPPI